MQTQFASRPVGVPAATVHPLPHARVYLEFKGGAARWLAVESRSADALERTLVQRIWNASAGGRVGVVLEMPEEFDAVAQANGESLADPDAPRPARYMVYQRVDEHGEILLRLRYFALARFHYAQIPGADRAAASR